MDCPEFTNQFKDFKEILDPVLDKMLFKCPLTLDSEPKPETLVEVLKRIACTSVDKKYNLSNIFKEKPAFFSKLTAMRIEKVK